MTPQRLERVLDDVVDGEPVGPASLMRHVGAINFACYQPAFDSEAFETMVAKGRKAWADVPDASAWVEAQRGAA